MDSEVDNESPIQINVETRDIVTALRKANDRIMELEIKLAAAMRVIEEQDGIPVMIEDSDDEEVTT